MWCCAPGLVSASVLKYHKASKTMGTANNQKHCHIQEDLNAPQHDYRTLKSWV